MTKADFWSYEEETIEDKRAKQALIFSRNIHAVEQEFHIDIDYDYDYGKFISKLKYLEWKNEEYKKMRNKK